MSDIEGLIGRWRSAGVLDAGAADRIRAFESEHKNHAGLHWQGLVALILGAILLACGVVLFVAAHWDDIGPGGRFALAMAMVAVYHLGGAMTRAGFRSLATALHAVGTVATGAAIALVGQTFNIQDHWPTAVLLWAIAALAGWALLRDEAQQTLTLLLFPAWLFTEIEYASDGRIGEGAYLGRFLIVWAVLYLTFFLESRRKVVQGILFAAAALAAVAGVAMTLEGWQSWSATQMFLSYSAQVWGWIAIAGLPLVIAAFKGHKGLIPPAAAIVLAALLPWCQRSWIYRSPHPGATPQTMYGPSLLAHVLVVAFAVFLIWWGVRVVSRALVNFGIVSFAIAVAWFYSDIFDKIGRSLGLIGLGVLFFAGGGALEKARCRLLAGLGSKTEEAQ